MHAEDSAVRAAGSSAGRAGFGQELDLIPAGAELPIHAVHKGSRALRATPGLLGSRVTMDNRV